MTRGIRLMSDFRLFSYHCAAGHCHCHCIMYGRKIAFARILSGAVKENFGLSGIAGAAYTYPNKYIYNISLNMHNTRVAHILEVGYVQSVGGGGEGGECVGVAQLLSIVALQFPDFSQRSFCVLLQISLAVYMVINVRLHFAHERHELPQKEIDFSCRFNGAGRQRRLLVTCTRPLPKPPSPRGPFFASPGIFCVIVKHWTGQCPDTCSSSAAVAGLHTKICRDLRQMSSKH